MKKTRSVLLLVCAIVVLVFSACVPGDGKAGPENPAGFWWGIWHGWVAPVSVIIGFFNKNIRVYEVHNTGHWYDVGFYIAMIGGFGGIALTRKRKRDKGE